MLSKKRYGDEEGLAFADRGRMHFAGTGDASFRHEKHNPLWAASDQKIRLVIFNMLYQYVGANVFHKDLHAGISMAELEQLARQTQQRLLASRFDSVRIQKHVATTQNGMAGMLVRLIYMAYRQRLRSPGIAEELNMSPVQVRQKLRRINDVARRLYPSDCCERARSFKPEKHSRTGNGRWIVIPEEVVAAIAVEYNEGASIKALAERCGVTRATVRHRLRKHGVILRKGYHSRDLDTLLTTYPSGKRRSSRYSAEAVKAMAALYGEGNSLVVVGRAFGCSHTLVYKLLRKSGVARRRCGWRLGGRKHV